MELGAFSISLTVEDLEVSHGFYQKLGFEQVGGEMEQQYLIMKNGNAVIGLFQGMFEKNILTFNPGPAVGTRAPLDDFADVREIQTHIKEQGLALEVECDPESEGPAHIVLNDPDGNPILIDQFF